MGDVEKEGNVLVVRRIHVRYRLKAAPEQRETAERVLAFHADFCPMYRSIKAAIEVTTSLEFIAPE